MADINQTSKDDGAHLCMIFQIEANGQPNGPIKNSERLIVLVIVDTPSPFNRSFGAGPVFVIPLSPRSCARAFVW